MFSVYKLNSHFIPPFLTGYRNESIIALHGELKLTIHVLSLDKLLAEKGAYQLDLSLGKSTVIKGHNYEEKRHRNSSSGLTQFTLLAALPWKSQRAFWTRRQLFSGWG